MNLEPHPGVIPGSIPGLETLMDAAWPAVEREESGGWVLRAASGVTQRANSVWPRDPGEDPHRQLAAVRDARLWYRSRRLPLIFQIFDGPRHAALNAVLDAEGFTRQSETLVLVHVPGASPAWSPARTPAAPNLPWKFRPSRRRNGWNCGGASTAAGERTSSPWPAAFSKGAPRWYALVRDDGGAPAAVARLALPTDAARPGPAGAGCTAWQRARTRGGAAMAAGLPGRCCSEGDARGLVGYWLLVMASNAGARSCMPGPASVKPPATSTVRTGRSGT